MSKPAYSLIRGLDVAFMGFLVSHTQEVTGGGSKLGTKVHHCSTHTSNVHQSTKRASVFEKQSQPPIF